MDKEQFILLAGAFTLILVINAVGNKKLKEQLEQIEEMENEQTLENEMIRINEIENRIVNLKNDSPLAIKFYNKRKMEQELEYYKNYYKKMQAFIKYYNDDRMREEWEQFNNMFNREEGLA